MAPRRDCKVDSNQSSIVNGLRACGLTVESLASVGNGCPDILVGGNKRNVLIEIKVVGLKLNPKQATWHQTWRGRAWVVNSLKGAVTVCVEEGLLSWADVGDGGRLLRE